MSKIDFPPKEKGSSTDFSLASERAAEERKKRADEELFGTSPETGTQNLGGDQEPFLQQVETRTPEPAEDEPLSFTADQTP